MQQKKISIKNTLFLIFKNRLLLTSVLILLFAVFASVLPLSIHRGFYTLSLLIKDVLLFFLPVIVGFYIAASLSSFQKKAPLFLVTLLIFEFFSNAFSVSYAYFMGLELWGSIEHQSLMMIAIENLDPFFRINQFKPQWLSIQKGTIAGVILGLLHVYIHHPLLDNLLLRGKKISEFLLVRIFSKLIPIFLLGFLSNMYCSGLFSKLFSALSQGVLYAVFITLSYLGILLFIAAKGRIKVMLFNLKNLLPAGITSFSSGCSLATMPLTIYGTEKNLSHPGFAKMIIPSTTNIQQVGDCLINSFMCLIILKQFGFPFPSFSSWAIFTFFYCLTRYATAAVLGGAIFILLPLYETYLGFTPEMLAILLAINVFFDPIITAANVMANGFLCQIFEQVWVFMNGKKLHHLEVGENHQINLPHLP